MTDQRAFLAGGPVDVESLILLEARPCAGESDAQIVAGAWDFARINGRYAKHQEILTRRPRGRLNSEVAAKAFHRWLREERETWMEALWHDPLLPNALLPYGYAGRRACEARLAVMQEVGQQMRGFKTEGGARHYLIRSDQIMSQDFGSCTFHRGEFGLQRVHP